MPNSFILIQIVLDLSDISLQGKTFMLLWSIWNERNTHLWRDQHSVPHQIVRAVKFCLSSWLNLQLPTGGAIGSH